MDAQLDAIQQAVNLAVDKSIRPLWWWQILIVPLAVIVSYLVAYGKRKGQNYATKEDFKELLRQVQATTKATEEIKADISSGLWVDQKRWQMRKTLYLILLENLRNSSKGLGEVIEAEEGIFDGSKRQRSKHINESLETIKHASDEIRKAVNLSGVLFLSDRALEVLRVYESAEKNRLNALSRQTDSYGDIAAEATSWSAYLQSQLEAAEVAYTEIVQVAKEDLRIQG